MKITQQGIDDILVILAETPERFAAASQDRTLEQLHRRPEPKSWSVNEILAHLRACADVWGLDIKRMLSEDAPSLPDVHPTIHLKGTDYPDLEFQTSLAAFAEQRKSLLIKLKSLGFQDWSRTARIKDRTHTVFSQARRMALHEQGHWDQVAGAARGKA